MADEGLEAVNQTEALINALPDKGKWKKTSYNDLVAAANYYKYLHDDQQAGVHNAGKLQSLAEAYLKDDAEQKEYADGTYQGSGKGFKGTIKVEVTIEDHKITSIQEVSQHESAYKWNKAKSLFDKIVHAQFINVDTISGATLTSRGILSAVEDALEQSQEQK